MIRRSYASDPIMPASVMGQFDMRRFADATREYELAGLSAPWAVVLSVPRALPWAGIGARRWRLRPSAGYGFLGSVTTSAFSQTDPTRHHCTGVVILEVQSEFSSESLAVYRPLGSLPVFCVHKRVSQVARIPSGVSVMQEQCCWNRRLCGRSEPS
jgi:hypothetical protein